MDTKEKIIVSTAVNPPRTESRRKTGRRTLLWSAGVTLAGLVVGWWIYDGEGVAATTKVPSDSRRGPTLDGEFIRFSDDYATRNGITSVEVKNLAIEPEVTANGEVTHDPRRFAAVGARIPGRVSRVMKTVGDTIRANEPLVVIESAELGRVQAQALSMRAKELAAEAQMKRDCRLADAKVTSERDAEFSKAEYEGVSAERRAAEQAVIALGGDLKDFSGSLVLRSPIAGKLISADAARGQTVDPTATLFEVADLATVWIELRIFERDLASLKVGDSVAIRTHASPPQNLKGTISQVGDVLDRETRSATVRVVVDNAERLLRPGQSVHARIQAAAAAGTFLGIPRGAITRIDGKPTAFVLVEKNVIEPRAIKVGHEDKQDVAVLEGLRSGERVIHGGLFELKSELFR